LWSSSVGRACVLLPWWRLGTSRGVAATSSELGSELRRAVGQGDLKGVRAALAGSSSGRTLGAEVSRSGAGNRLRSTPLHVAARGHVGDAILGALLAAPRAAVDVRDSTGRTALSIAVKRGAVGAVRAMLARAGTGLDREGLLALAAAAEAGARAKAARAGGRVGGKVMRAAQMLREAAGAAKLGASSQKNGGAWWVRAGRGAEEGKRLPLLSPVGPGGGGVGATLRPFALRGVAREREWARQERAVAKAHHAEKVRRIEEAMKVKRAVVKAEKKTAAAQRAAHLEARANRARARSEQILRDSRRMSQNVRVKIMHTLRGKKKKEEMWQLKHRTARKERRHVERAKELRRRASKDLNSAILASMRTKTLSRAARRKMAMSRAARRKKAMSQSARRKKAMSQSARRLAPRDLPSAAS